KTLGDDTGAWLYNTIRGEDTSEVNPRTQIKSMLSAKSFRPSINDFDAACKWLRIFVADIYSRLVDEGVLENKRRPKTISLHHRQGGQTRSRACPIPMGKAITQDGLFLLAKNLLSQVVVDGRAWPCANLSLSVGGFEDGVQGNMGIGSFLVRGDQAKSLPVPPATHDQPAAKRRRVGEGGIAKFFGMPSEESRSSSIGDMDDDGEAALPRTDSTHDLPATQARNATNGNDPSMPPPSAQPSRPTTPDRVQPKPPEEIIGPSYSCPRCSNVMPEEQRLEHDDYHFALDLSTQTVTPPRPPATPAEHVDSSSRLDGRGGSRGRGRPTKSGEGERGKGQKRLAFG
ncbi:hypothetical protein B0A51_18848, partial [Rachicladosporium sp. CCFEE 5018]